MSRYCIFVLFHEVSKMSNYHGMRKAFGYLFLKTTLLITCIFQFTSFISEYVNKNLWHFDLFLNVVLQLHLVLAGYFKSYIYIYLVHCNNSFIIFTKVNCILTENETSNLGYHTSGFGWFVFFFFICPWLILHENTKLHSDREGMELEQWLLCPSLPLVLETLGSSLKTKLKNSPK